MNKIKVGNAPPPNLKQVRSKIGSLDNATHKPGGGKIKIETKKLEFHVQPRIEAKNQAYAPKGGEKKVIVLGCLQIVRRIRFSDSFFILCTSWDPKFQFIQILVYKIIVSTIEIIYWFKAINS